MATPSAATIVRLVLVGGPPLLVAVAVVLNAWSGLMPGVGFWDTGEFQTVLPLLGTAHPTGYPTYVLLGFAANLLLAPLGEPAFRITVLSLLAVAFAAATTVVLVRRLTGSTLIAAASGLGLATTPVVWANATRADPHPIHLAFVALLWLLLVRWEQARGAGSPAADRWLVAAAAVFGLAAANHSLTLLLAPPVGLYVLAVDARVLSAPRLVVGCVVAAIAAYGLVYLELPLRAGLFRAPLVYGHPETWDGFWSIALGEQFRGSLVDPFGNLGPKVAQLWTFAGQQLGLLAFAILPAFVITVVRAPRYALLSGLAMLITLWFDVSYRNADIGRYYLGPVLWAWTWLGVLGASIVDGIAGLAALLNRRRAEADSGRILRVGAAALIGVSLLLPSLLDWDGRRFQADRHADTSASRWLDEILPGLARDAVVVSWWSTSTPLWYAQLVEGRRTDIFIVDDRTVHDQGFGSAAAVIGRFLGQRPVYVIRANSRELGEIRGEYDLEPAAGAGELTVWHVVGRRTASR
ncbi:MAG TPA: DUF2723 domain-containing protein [Candidatus Eisenbacteria bacterium]|nr:DUF2723 domain-containing protein [Candidatus Eisenbacteria bacterium]